MISKVIISSKASKLLNDYQAKIGLRPNILARNALVFSLKNGDKFDGANKPKTDGKEFNLYTLLGDNEEIYYLLLKEFYKHQFSKYNLSELIVFHIEQGLLKEGFLSVFTVLP